MSAAVDKAALLASRGLRTETVELDGFAGVTGEVTVRGLTRSEVLAIQKGGALDPEVMEQKLLACALVEPKLTEEEIAQWQSVAPAGELEPVTDTVQRMSGLAVKAVKTEMQRFR